MIHLRLIVPAEQRAAVLAHLAALDGVAHVVHLPGAAVKPAGDVVLVDVAREAANDLIEWLQRHDLHHAGAITIDHPDAVVSDAAARADAAAPGNGADALIWEQVEAVARAESKSTVSFLVFMGIAAGIALVGILLDSPILIVGAMVVGPDYGPLAASCVALARRRYRRAAFAMRSLVTGLAVGAAGVFVLTHALRFTGLAPERYDLTDRQLTAFIAHPDGLAFVVAVLAGVAGMLSLTQSRGGALIGVLVSVTTIPAVANVGAASAYGEWNELGGAAAQLAINVAGLIVAGVATLGVQHALTVRRGQATRDNVDPIISAKLSQ